MKSDRSDSTMRCRGNIAIITALGIVMLVGFGALAVDIAMLVDAREQLTTAADHCAMSTLHYVVNLEATEEDPAGRARDFAKGFMPLNAVSGRQVHLGDADISLVNITQANNGLFLNYSPWADGSPFPYNGVRIEAHLGGGQGSDTSLSPILGGIFGQTQYQISRSSFAMLAPRNIVLVVDASNSMRIDSRLEGLPAVVNLQVDHPDARINLGEVWDAFPTEPSGPWNFNGASPTNPGPVYGYYMNKFGYGLKDEFINSTYRPKRVSDGPGMKADKGLLYLPPDVSWGSGSSDSDASLQAAFLVSVLKAMGYNASLPPGAPPGTLPEVTVINTPSSNASAMVRLHNWIDRVKVAMGLVGWNSGLPRGRWFTEGWAPLGTPTYGDNNVDPNELVDIGVPLPPELPQQAAFPGWDLYVFVQKSNQVNYGGGAYADFRSCFGVKTLMEYLLRQSTPTLIEGARLTEKVQPWTSVRLSIEAFLDSLGAFNNNDLIGLVRYGTEASTWMGLQGVGTMQELNEALLADYPDALKTNIPAGISAALDILTANVPVDGEWPGSVAQAPNEIGERLIILLTDGLPCLSGCGGSICEDPAVIECSTNQALATAEEAAAVGVKIHTITIGADSDAEFGADLSCAGWEGENGVCDEGEGGLHAHYDAGYIANQEGMTEFFNTQMLQLHGVTLLAGHDLQEN